MSGGYDPFLNQPGLSDYERQLQLDQQLQLQLQQQQQTGAAAGGGKLSVTGVLVGLAVVIGVPILIAGFATDWTFQWPGERRKK